MSTITTEDGTEIYYKDWGEGPAVTLSHGWPLSADARGGQMLFLAQQRPIVFDQAKDRMYPSWPCLSRRWWPE